MFESFSVYLRALEAEDFKTTIKWRNDEEIWDMVCGPRYYVSILYEKKWIEDVIFSADRNLVLGICTKSDNELIGLIYLNNIDHKNRSASFSKLIGEKRYWGRGYGKEATILMLLHAFNVLGMERVEARQLISNSSSIAVNKKCGFSDEGVLRKAIFKNGKQQDINLMSITKDDFKKILMKNEK